MIKNLKKGFGGDYGVKMKPNRLHMLCEVEWPYGSRMATREYHELKNSGSPLLWFRPAWLLVQIVVV